MPNGYFRIKSLWRFVLFFFFSSNGWNCLMDFVKLHFRIMLLFNCKKKRERGEKWGIHFNSSHPKRTSNSSLEKSNCDSLLHFLNIIVWLFLFSKKSVLLLTFKKEIWQGERKWYLRLTKTEILQELCIEAVWFKKKKINLFASHSMGHQVEERVSQFHYPCPSWILHYELM